ncbi:cation transport P-type ATPase [Mycoplasma sp. CAG:956]|nr:cation transport P-type ATPase [Mycoplasma sp. CAG:956]
MKKYKYNINNLDCANCAREIEEMLNNNTNFNNAIVNFSTCKISYESDKDYTLEELNTLIKSVEPDAYITLNEEAEESTSKEYYLSILIIALVMGLLGYFLPLPKIVKIILYLISYSLLLYKTSINAIKLLKKGSGINENALITVSCIGALLIGEVLEGMMVITLYTIGKILEEKAINNSRKSIKDLLDIKEPFAYLVDGKKIVKIPVEEVKKDDVLVVKKGEKVPVDGVIIKGSSSLDTSALTGESELVSVNVSDEVLSGSINMGDVLEIKATNTFSNSTVAKILDLLESATDKKTKTENMVTKFSKVYTPIIIGLAILITIILPLIFKVPFKTSLYRALTFLVISCPCAIAISVPLSYFTGIGTASKKGILVKGSNYLDNLSNTTSIIFDKTGTLTNGTFNVERIEVLDDKYSKEEIIDILIKGESLSNHPIAKSILKLKKGKIDNSNVLDYKEIEGNGISFKLNKKNVLIGNSKLCGCDIDTDLHLNINGKHVASVVINDGIKENAKETINKLKNSNIKTYMFTGDKKAVALNIGKKLGLDEIKYEMLPQDKFKAFEKVSDNSEVTIFVGDGINDAPVLRRADIGISMGGVGSDSAIEASDIVLMSDELSRIPLAINISKYTKRIIKENLIFAMSVKVVILLLSVFGYANMWLAVFADTGVTLLTILNTLRIMNKFKKEN